MYKKDTLAYLKTFHIFVFCKFLYKTIPGGVPCEQQLNMGQSILSHRRKPFRSGVDSGTRCRWSVLWVLLRHLITAPF